MFLYKFTRDLMMMKSKKSLVINNKPKKRAQWKVSSMLFINCGFFLQSFYYSVIVVFVCGARSLVQLVNPISKDFFRADGL